MPKFKIEKSVDAKAVLQRLGMTDAFSPLVGVADFSGMADFSSPTSPDDDLYIEDVLQRAFVAVNEKGAEAAAATHGMPAPASAPPTPLPPVVMIVDRPFVFFIQDTHTDTILFLGRVCRSQRDRLAGRKTSIAAGLPSAILAQPLASLSITRARFR